MNEITAFFKAYYVQKKDFYLKYEAEKYGLTKENFWDVVLKPSAVTAEDFEPIERKLGVTLPGTFKDFYQAHYSLEQDFDTGGLFIAGNMEGSQLSSLTEYLFENGLSETITGFGLIPFGLYNDEWYTCLDMNKNAENPPIVLFEMSNWRAGKEAISHRPWFSSFAGFLRCITDYQTTGNWDNFDELDPGNHYESAYDYWKT